MRLLSKTTTLSPELKKVSKIFSFETFENGKLKVQNEEHLLKEIIRSALIMKLQECNSKIANFEGKYGQIFEMFTADWDKDKIIDKYSYRTEGDYIDWEALELLKKDILALLIKL